MGPTPAASSGTAAYDAGVITWTDTISSGVESVTFSGITNPTTEAPFFVRITTRTGAGPYTTIDEGTVASAITEGIYITSRVAETLGFSTTANFATGVGDPGASCDPLTGLGNIALGDPTENTLAVNTTYNAYSAFRVYTNAASGVNIFYEGATLTKGGDTINPVATLVTPAVGTEQFGLGVDVDNGGDGSASTFATNSVIGGTVNSTYVDTSANFGDTGQIDIETNYLGGGDDDEFSFAAGTPTLVASSDSYVECNTAGVNYIANISPLTPAGTYTTTIVYSAVPTY